MPYDPEFRWRTAPEDTRLGASVPALVRLGEELGYRAVGSNVYGFNLVFARADVVPELPAIAANEFLARADVGRY